jgi:hypothetical protein
MDELIGKSFKMFAVRRYSERHKEIFYWGFGVRKYAECFLVEESEVVVEVEITIDPNGSYWAMYMIEDNMLNYVYPNEAAFSVCFPYGPETEEGRMNCKIVRCTVKENN